MSETCKPAFDVSEFGCNCNYAANDDDITTYGYQE